MPIKSCFPAECCVSHSFWMVCNAVFLQPRQGAWGSPATLPHYSLCVTAGLWPRWQQGHQAVCEQLLSLLTLHLLQPPAWTRLCCLPDLPELHLQRSQAALHCCPLKGGHGEMLEGISFCKVPFAEQPKRRQSPGSQAGQTYRLCWMFLGIFA